MAQRKATVERNTLETRITATVNLDGSGSTEFDTGVPSGAHAGPDRPARPHRPGDKGQWRPAYRRSPHRGGHRHHPGQASPPRWATRRHRATAYAYVPLDEALSRVVMDFSGPPGPGINMPFTRAAVGGFDVDLFREFFQGFVNHAQVTLHIDNLRGDNSHHQAETVFKAFGRALRMALAADERMAGTMPSTKGVL